MEQVAEYIHIHAHLKYCIFIGGESESEETIPTPPLKHAGIE